MVVNDEISNKDTKINILDKPDFKGKIIADFIFISSGNPIKYTAVSTYKYESPDGNGYWYEVKINNQKGYVFGHFLKKK